MKKSPSSRFSRILPAFALVCAFSLLGQLRGWAAVTTETWGGSVAAWETTANWTPTPAGFPFNNTEAALFTNAGSTTVTLGQAETVNNLQFKSGSSTLAFTFGGSALTIDVAAVSALPTGLTGAETTGTETFNNAVTIEDTTATTASTTFVGINQSGNGGTLTFGGSLTLEANGASGNNNLFSVTAGAGGTININGAFSDDQATTALIFNGAGTIDFNPGSLTLTDNAITDFAGSASTATTLTGGLYLGTNGSSVVPTGTTPIAISGATGISALLLAGTGQIDSGAITAGQSGTTLSIFGSNNTSATMLSPVTNTYSGTYSLPAGAVGNATFEFYAGAFNTFNITTAIGSSMNPANSSGSQFGDMVDINGGGTVVFGAAGTNNAPINIIGGTTLKIGNGTALGFGGPLGYNYLNNTNVVLIGVPTTTVGTGSPNTGSLDLNGQTINNVIALNGGNLTNTSSTAAIIQNGVAGINLTNAGTGYVASSSVAVTLSGGGGSGAAASGKSALGSAGKDASFAGVYQVTTTTAGSGYTSAPTVTIANNGTGTTATGTAVLSNVSLTGTSNTIGGSNGNMTINAVVSGSGGGFSKVGTDTVTLNGINTYSGATTVSAGTLALGATGSIASTPGINVASGATYDVSAVGAYSVAAGQTLSGGGTVNNTGNTTTIAAGAFLTPSSVSIAATQLKFNGNLVLAGSTNLTIYSGATDSVAITGGTLTYGGSLTVAINGTETNGLYGLFTGETSTSSNFASVTVDGMSLTNNSGTWTGTGTGGESATFYTSGLNDGDLVLGAVPEPSRWSLLLIGTVVLAGVAWRRSRLAKESSVL